jgi:hypothetical protein
MGEQLVSAKSRRFKRAASHAARVPTGIWPGLVTITEHDIPGRVLADVAVRDAARYDISKLVVFAVRIKVQHACVPPNGFIAEGRRTACRIHP